MNQIHIMLVNAARPESMENTKWRCWVYDCSESFLPFTSKPDLTHFFQIETNTVRLVHHFRYLFKKHPIKQKSAAH